MLLTDPELIKLLKIKPHERVIDIGGSMNQHQEIKIDTLLDIIHPSEAPYGKSELKAKKFVRADITRDKLPFKDKEFDVCLCTHTLEDLPSPFQIMDEMGRVAKRGIIVTPSMGHDLVFTQIDFTDWLTGARRVPGEAHHKWFFVNSGKELEVIPKYYGILYTPEFQVTGWSGEEEMVYLWRGKIKYKEFVSLNIHKLIDKYVRFFKKNAKYIKKGRTLFFVDTPLNMAWAFVKIILKHGWGYKYRKKLV